MEVPEFDEDGYLPEGRYLVTAEEMKVALVDRFPESTSRHDIFEHWVNHREALRSLVPAEKQWIGGSFVTAKRDPGDIDVCTFVDGPAMEELPPHLLMLAQSLLAGKITQAFWRCDSYSVVVYPEDSPGHEQYLAAAKYWSNWWAQTRPDESGVQRVRGYLEAT